MTTNGTHTINHFNVKDNTGIIAATVIITVTIIVVLLVPVLFVNDHNDEHFTNQVTYVKWEYVNLRKNHNVGSEIIEQLHEGDKVELTSHVFEAWDTEWIFIRSEKGNGWVVTSSLQEPNV